jgi:hypothetical protein
MPSRNAESVRYEPGKSVSGSYVTRWLYRCSSSHRLTGSVSCKIAGIAYCSPGLRSGTSCRASRIRQSLHCAKRQTVCRLARSPRKREHVPSSFR